MHTATGQLTSDDPGVPAAQSRDRGLPGGLPAASGEVRSEQRQRG